jgi:hypothetical protein
MSWSAPPEPVAAPPPPAGAGRSPDGPPGRRDTWSVGTRVSSSRLVGRAGELAELEAALADAAAGRPSLVFVAGESGVGKTRLLAELGRRAERAGARVLRGGGMGPGEEELPYGPLLGALRPLARDGEVVLDELPRGARAELGRLMSTGPPAPSFRSWPARWDRSGPWCC